MPPWLADYIGILGPIGVFLFLFGYGVVLPIAKMHYESAKHAADRRAEQPASTVDAATKVHIQSIPEQTSRLVWEQGQEVRDCVRDTAKTVVEIDRMQDRELQHLNNLVVAQASTAENTRRTAEALERLEKRQEETNQRSERIERVVNELARRGGQRS